MNYNPAAGRHGNKLSAKRVKPPHIETTPMNAMPPPFNPYPQVPSVPMGEPVYPRVDPRYEHYEPSVPPQVAASPLNPSHQYGGTQPLPNPGPQVPGEFLANPLVNAAIMSYGQQIMGSGKSYVDRELEKYVPVSRLKYYFAVDTAYVYRKLILIFFPFAHKDWSVKYASNEPVQPRYEVNAPDLYIPSMAYLTYVLVAGLALGTQNRFTPEVLGIQASSALVWTTLEILVHMISLYITAISTSLTTIDILAFCGYKFVGIIFAVLSSLLFHRLGYYICLIYCSISLSFFLMRTLKVKILPLNTTPGDPYSMQRQHVEGNKRRIYLLLFMAGVQPILMWWMSYHLVPAKSVSAPT